MIRVFNLSTQEEQFYFDTITPQQAVICAYEQFTKKNFNTWEYPSPDNHPLFQRGRSGRTFFCGDWGTCTEVQK